MRYVKRNEVLAKSMWNSHWQ